MKLSPQQKIGPLKAAVLDWLGIPITLTDGAFWSAYYGRESADGVNVNQHAVMQLSTVWACVRLISETIATLPLSMYERTSKGKQVATGHPLHFIVHDQPNPDSTASVFWEAVVATMLLRGNARAEKLMLGQKLVGLVFLDPNRLSVTRKLNGGKEYRYREENGTERVIPPAKIWNIPAFTLNGKDGLSAIQYGVQVFGAAIAAERAAARTFKNGLLQTVYYRFKNFLKPGQREEFRNNLAEALERGAAPLLEGGIEADTLGLNPNDAQLLESRAFSVEEICRWFRVPAWMVSHTEKSTSWGTGIESQMIGFLTFTLAPWLKRIEQSISKDLLKPSERLRFYPKFAVEGLLRADSAARSTFYGIMVDKGILTRDEVRELEDRPPMGGNAAVLTVQSAMTTLDAIGSDPVEAQARNALRAFLGFEDPTPAAGQ